MGREHPTLRLHSGQAAAVRAGPEREQLRTHYETKFRKRKENNLLMRIHMKHGPISKTKVFGIGHRLISCFPEAPAERPSEAISERESEARPRAERFNHAK